MASRVTPRIVLAGNNLAAILVLDLILEMAGPDSVLCVAPPGGHHAWQPSLADHAAGAMVPCITPEDVNEETVVDDVIGFRPSLFLSVYYTQLFRPALLEALDCPVLNFHPSLLPRHRGTAPLIWAIMEGDRSTGLTCHHVDEGVDTGPIVKQWEIGIDRAETGYSLHQKMAVQVEMMAKELLKEHFRGEKVDRGIRQVGDSTYHSSKTPTLNHIDWTQPRERIRNIVRANCPPLHGAYMMAGERKIVLGRVEPGDYTFGLPPSEVVIDELGHPYIWAADGPLRIVTYLADTELVSGTFLPGVLEHGQVVT